MKVSGREVQQRMRRFEEVCRARGIKLTPQRMQIFREVAETGDHPDAEAVYRGVRAHMPTVSLDTVYRTLWLLIDLGLVRTLGPPRERTRFDANLDEHHHFICVRCGLTRDIAGDAFGRLTPPQSVAAIGHVEATRVELLGVCRACAAQAHSTQGGPGGEEADP